MEQRRRLVKRAQKGDEEAFIALMRQYESVLYAGASRMLRHEADVADVMQETVLIAYTKLHTLRDATFIHTWLYKIMLNECHRLMRKREREGNGNAVKQEARTNDTYTVELEEAILALSPAYREVVTLRYVMELTTREIADVLEIPEGTIKARLSRARQQLKDTYYREERESG
ncbi:MULTISPECIES: RNA polymerase sigma factor [Exiguobacterium]|uniref:RNA polymerase sigma factor n=1 Tax=Exiguobacterium TaxID=33986 RepID=UPI001BE9E18E|nr:MULTISPECIES: sigma-70 family RNA polymerase sigma factor [Exiguobacterium]MCT4784599.1 sigma-70 family RNA polymerase sigma factor [Exiguobacterium himgiriensis]